MSLSSAIYSQWIIAFALNFCLIAVSQSFPLLTKKGWIHAGILGTILFGTLGLNGWLAVVLYLLVGSLVTKIGFKHKQAKGIAEARGGRRGPENVWGSAATGAFIAILIGLEVASERILLIGFAASFAAKLADTFGSEIGKRWGRKAFLITTFNRVEAGTEGAISLEGTLASVIGSILMTVVMIKLHLVPFGLLSLVVVCSGVIATLLESYLGAIIQNKYNWCTNEIINFFQTSFAAVFSIIIAINLNL